MLIIKHTNTKKQNKMKNLIKGLYKNNKSKLVWFVDDLQDEVVVYRNNQTKLISKENFLKNWTKHI
jgi:hypothetical protein